jgi:hypothetical protein
MAKPDPWQTEAEILAKLAECSLADATDNVIIRWLEAGDTRPLASALMTGHVPSDLVRRYLGLMLDPDGSTLDEDSGEELVPYRLDAVARSGKGGNSIKPEILPRDLLAATAVKQAMTAGETYEIAVVEIAKKMGVGEDTLKKAYSKWYGREAHRKQSGD